MVPNAKSWINSNLSFVCLQSLVTNIIHRLAGEYPTHATDPYLIALRLSAAAVLPLMIARKASGHVLVAGSTRVLRSPKRQLHRPRNRLDFVIADQPNLKHQPRRHCSLTMRSHGLSKAQKRSVATSGDRFGPARYTQWTISP